MRYMAFWAVLLATAVLAILGVKLSPAFLWPLIVLAPLSLLGIWNLAQTKHSLLRNYPLLAHFRWMFEDIRPEIQQYFVENDTDGRPFDRDARTQIYERAKDVNQESAFGTELNVYEAGYEWGMTEYHLRYGGDLVWEIGSGYFGTPRREP